MAIEDFSTYTEVDPNSRIVVGTRRVAWTDLTQDEDAYVYADKGAAYFSGDFIHYLTVRLSDKANTIRGHFWALTNTLDDLWGIDTANGSYLALRLEWNDPNLTFRLQECDSGTTYESSTRAISEDTTYYIKIVRDESAGAYGTLYLYIYSDANRTTPIGATVSRTLHTSKKDFQYVHAIISFDNNSGTYTMSGYTQDLELLAVLTEDLELANMAMTDITTTTATGNAVIVNLGLSSVTEHGHCWATSLDPTTVDSKTTNGAGVVGVFSSSITGLIEGQQYYTRAYATNTQGTAYSPNIKFIAGRSSTQLGEGEIGIKSTRLHYVGNDGKERWLEGTLV